MAERILVVDDERVIRKLLVSYLSEEGFEVEIATDSDAAIELLKKQAFDLVVTDIKMPGADGIFLAGYIDENYNLPVVMITGYPSEENVIAAMRRGVSDFLTKPFSPDILCKIIWRTLYRHTQRNRLRVISVASESGKETLLDGREAYGDTHDKLMSLQEVASYLNVSVQTVYRMISRGELKGIKVGVKWRFKPEYVKGAYLRRQS